MIDFNFNDTRNFAIADVHGVISDQLSFKHMLSLFDVWII